MLSKSGSVHTTTTNSPPDSPEQMGTNIDSSSSSLTTNTILKDITIVNFLATLKLTSTNYLGWKTQIKAILHGLDLYWFINGSHLAPTPTIDIDGTTTLHVDYQKWSRQDRLLFGALVGTISPKIVPLVTNALSSRETWQILVNTYASPSQGHIKQ